MSCFLPLILLLVFGTSFFIPVLAEPGTLINLSNTDGLSYRAQLYAQGDDIFVVWQDDSTGDGDIFFSKGSASSLIFESPINLSDNTGKSSFPRFSISGDNVFITWYDYSPGTSDIYFAQSSDGGSTFKTINLSQNEGVSYNPWISSSENNVYVVWNDDTSKDKNPQRESKNQTSYFDISVGNFEILVATSHDKGSSFEITNLSNTLGGSQNPRMASSGNYVYVVWTETQEPRNIFLSVSTDGGLTFNEPVNVSNTPNKSADAVIQPYDNAVHVLWREKGQQTSDIFYAKSENNGMTFGIPIKLSEEGIDLQLTRDTQMIVSENEIFVVWYENAQSNTGVFFVKSIDNGKTFTKPINLSGQEGRVGYPQIAKNGNEIYVIWNDNSLGNQEVFLRTSTDGGENFGSIVNLSNDYLESQIFVLGPQIISTDNGDVLTIFERKEINHSDLYVKKIPSTQIQKEGALFLQTINGRVNINVDISDGWPGTEFPANFTLTFVNSNSGESLENVNYSFLIEDIEGNTIVSNQNQFATMGMDTQNVKFSKQGPMTVIINVHGTGDETPYDTHFAGQASAIITVVPEFPNGLFLIMIPVLSIVIVLSKYIPKIKINNPKNT